MPKLTKPASPSPDLEAVLRFEESVRGPLSDADREEITRHACDPATAPLFAAHLTDVGNAYRFAWAFDHSVRFVPGWGWVAWDGRRWVPDGAGVQEHAKLLLHHMLNEVGEDKARAKHAARSQSRAGVSAMLALAESDPRLRVPADHFDADPWLLNVLNGTIDLRVPAGPDDRRGLRDHRRQDYLTKLTEVRYEGATCPLWLDFLGQVFDGDANLVSFVQRAVGYSLTGDTREECLFLLHGSGANGKSTFLNVIRALLGDYSRSARAETFLSAHQGGIPNDLADLRGARFIHAAEAERGAQLAVALIKRFTGRDPVKARFLYREHFEYFPQGKLWLAVNDLPRVPAGDPAIWRRMQVIPFVVTIPPEKRDKALGQKLLAELPGILTWAVDGCRAWQHQGLGAAKAVESAVQSYQAANDTVAAFVNECCQVGAGDAPAEGLYQAYAKWRPGALSRAEFKGRLQALGHVQKETAKSNVWKGLELNPTPPLIGDEWKKVPA